MFENVIKVKEDKLLITEDLLEKKNQGYSAGLFKSENFINENEIVEKLKTCEYLEIF